MSDIYDFFDDIICIKYKKNVNNIFNDLNIPVKYYIINDTNIFKYHIKLLKDAFENNFDNILIFDDNIVQTDSYNLENIKIAINFMKSNNNWDILYLGYDCISYQHKYNYNIINTIFNSSMINENIVKCDISSSFAVCYNKRSFKKILDTYEDYINVIEYDKYLAEYINLNNYCFLPMLFTKKYNETLCDCCFIKFIIDYLCNININYNISLIKYNYNNNYYSTYILCICVIMFCIIKYKLKILVNYNKKNILDRCIDTLDTNNYIIRCLINCM